MKAKPKEVRTMARLMLERIKVQIDNLQQVLGDENVPISAEERRLLTEIASRKKKITTDTEG